MLRADLDVAEEDIARLNNPEMAKRLLAAADRLFEQLMREAITIGRLPLERIPPEPILLNIAAALVAQAALNLGGSKDTRQLLLRNMWKGASVLLDNCIEETSSDPQTTH